MSNRTPFATKTPFLSLQSGNPFASPGDVPDNAPEGSYTYKLVESAPQVPAEEVETAARAVEIVIRWGATTLHIAHLSPARTFVVGEASEADKEAVDFELPASVIGAKRLPIVRTVDGGQARIVLPRGAKGTVSVAGKVVKISELSASDYPQSVFETENGLEAALYEGDKARFEISGVEIEIASVKAGRKVAGKLSLDRRGLPFQAMSLALHLGLLGAAAVLMPPSAIASESAITRDQMESMKAFLTAQAEREPEIEKGQQTASSEGSVDNASQKPNGGSEKPGRNSGPGLGPITPKRGQPEPLTRQEAIEMARRFGMVEMLNTLSKTMVSQPAWSDASTFMDPLMPLGNPFAESSLESGGDGTLSLTSIGEGGDTDGTGVRLDKIGIPTGPHNFGPRRPIPGGGHKTGDFTMRQKDVEVSSRLPAEVIQRTVRQNFGRFRLCYENGLRKNPNLAGRVAVRFVISRDGAVMSAANGGSDLPDTSVVSCVVSSFRGIQFPQNEAGGVSTVVYPIVFSPAR